jgi:hypothetical protein
LKLRDAKTLLQQAQDLEDLQEEREVILTIQRESTTMSEVLQKVIERFGGTIAEAFKRTVRYR